jgi:two-component system response regulator
MHLNQDVEFKPVKMLLVEDNPADVRLILEALEEAHICNPVTVLENGIDAMKFLQKQGKYASAEKPELILLDLNLPDKDGREVLQDVKCDPALKKIPVIILTTSAEEQDILRSCDLHAQYYLIKPLRVDAIIAAISSINRFRFSVVQSLDSPVNGEVEVHEHTVG